MSVNKGMSIFGSGLMIGALSNVLPLGILLLFAIGLGLFARGIFRETEKDKE